MFRMSRTMRGVSLVSLLFGLSRGSVTFADPADYNYVPSEIGTVSFSLSATLGDHMVLQRAPASAVVWGFAPVGTIVFTAFNNVKYASTAGADSVWRVHFAPMAAGGPYNITFEASSGETASLSDVLFGDVYMCGGQSNMQFSVGGNENSAQYAAEADKYPNIRLFTVGQGTSSLEPLMDLKTVLQKWTPAAARTVSDGSVFNYFSAVCWFFGKRVYEELGAKVPIGLVSNNWGGTRDEQWMPPATSLPCGHASSGELYNAMIVPYSIGPMSLVGFTWYQGEADLGGDASRPDQNNNYTCTQAAMITQWRHVFQVPHAFFGIVQLSTWFTDPLLLAELREQQLATMDLIPNFAFVTAADYGKGGDIHPPYKQYPGNRLAIAALSKVYGRVGNWRSPTYSTALQSGDGELTVWLNDVTDKGLVLKLPPNTMTVGNCTALNVKTPRTCAWAELQFDDDAKTWVNATVAIGADRMTIVLTAASPPGAIHIIASSYGWGAVPLMSVYSADRDGDEAQLPVLPWKRSLKADKFDDGQIIIV